MTTQLINLVRVRFVPLHRKNQMNTMTPTLEFERLGRASGKKWTPAIIQIVQCSMLATTTLHPVITSDISRQGITEGLYFPRCSTIQRIKYSTTKDTTKQFHLVELSAQYNIRFNYIHVVMEQPSPIHLNLQIVSTISSHLSIRLTTMSSRQLIPVYLIMSRSITLPSLLQMFSKF